MGAPWNMNFLVKNLKKDGWDVLNWDYKSRDFLIEEHGAKLATTLAGLAKESPFILLPIPFSKRGAQDDCF